MQYLISDPSNSLLEFEIIARQAFESSSDSELENWFSLKEMKENLAQGRGLYIKAMTEQNKAAGVCYAQKESPINGPEGEEKWVICLLAVLPAAQSQGVGHGLLTKLENEAKTRGCRKMFVYTNKEDERVIHFYKKHNYEDAGWVKDYQYGRGNSARFLLKYL